MNEHLTIHNFGPVREADVELRDLTIFVGPQATGKSLAAQVLYFLRGLEDMLAVEEVAPHEAILSAFRWWLGNDPAVYAGPKTVLGWDAGISTKGSFQEIRWSRNRVGLSGALKKRIVAWQRKKQRYPWSAQIYIPAGRTLYSFLTPPSALRYTSRAKQQWPGYIITFYEILGKALEELAPKQLANARAIRGPIGKRTRLFYDLQQLEQMIQPIFKGEIQYAHDTILLDTGKVQLRPVNIAAGQMEIWPFWAIVESGIKLKTLTSGTQVYFEEPEAHLHPGAQRIVMEIAALLVRRGVRVLMTTHSPYILYAINNFLMAQKVLDAGRTLPADVSPDTALRLDQVAAYRFSSEGQVIDIMDRETGLIDEDELDQVADNLGATFTHLQTSLAGVE